MNNVYRCYDTWINPAYFLYAIVIPIGLLLFLCLFIYILIIIQLICGNMSRQLVRNF